VDPVTGAEIAALRVSSGFSQLAFARALYISVHTLRNWEQDRRSPHGPALALLRIVARYPHLIADLTFDHSTELRTHHPEEDGYRE
jgi:putative transcriptional regulator